MCPLADFAKPAPLQPEVPESLESERVAPFVCRRILRTFVHRRPPRRYLRRCAAVESRKFWGRAHRRKNTTKREKGTDRMASMNLIVIV